MARVVRVGWGALACSVREGGGAATGMQRERFYTPLFSLLTLSPYFSTRMLCACVFLPCLRCLCWPAPASAGV